MKVLVIGHTSGIGKAIYDNCPDEYEVKGISRSTGHDIAENLPDVLGFIKEYQPDIFFNNVWGEGNQLAIANWYVDRFKKGVMITTGSTLGYMFLVENFDGFYDHIISQPYMRYSEDKAKLMLEAFMWKVRNKESKDLYWTNYSLGLTRTGLTSRDMDGNFDPTKHQDFPMLKADDVAKRMWKDVENKLYLKQIEVSLDEKRVWKDKDRIAVFMDLITNMEQYGA